MKKDSMVTTEKMKVEIWSDIMCPFCYIGKRKFEKAAEAFSNKNNIEVIWHSYQLDPTISYEPGRDLYSYLAERKGQSREWSVGVHQHVTNMAKEVGLTYDFDHAVIANSFDAHRLIQLAKKYDKGDEAEERLFSAYFTEGKNVSDHETLINIGAEIGLDKEEITQTLKSDAYADAVNRDISEAMQIGVQGVPFFVMNRKYGVSGAQPSEVFLQTLDKSYTEWRKEHPGVQIETAHGQVCTPDGDCK